jgi:hypothetical protein
MTSRTSADNRINIREPVEHQRSSGQQPLFASNRQTRPSPLAGRAGAEVLVQARDAHMAAADLHRAAADEAAAAGDPQRAVDHLEEALKHDRQAQEALLHYLDNNER